MSGPLRQQPDPTSDLILERVIDVPPTAVWAAWTTPSLLVQWFTPAPWKTIACELDLRPGGTFHTVMLSPDGEEFPSSGCVLEVVEGRKLVWTSALAPGFRPCSAEAEGTLPFTFTAVITIEPHAIGTSYTALAMHADAASAEKHSAMGFHQGWGAALDQLVALSKRLAAEQR